MKDISKEFFAAADDESAGGAEKTAKASEITVGYEKEAKAGESASGYEKEAKASETAGEVVEGKAAEAAELNREIAEEEAAEAGEDLLPDAVPVDPNEYGEPEKKRGNAPLTGGEELEFIPAIPVSESKLQIMGIFGYLLLLLACLAKSDYMIGLNIALRHKLFQLFLWPGIVVIALHFLILYSKKAYDYEGKIKLQKRIDENLLAKIPVNHGQALQVGSFNGLLAAEVGQHKPGIYLKVLVSEENPKIRSREQCEFNAAHKGVYKNAEFNSYKLDEVEKLKENEAASYDLLISSMAFHTIEELGPSARKEVLDSYLDLLKPGAFFIIQDFFEDKKYYPDKFIKRYLAELEAEGYSELQHEKTGKASFVPALLRPSFMLGKMSMISGFKPKEPLASREKRASAGEP